MARPQKKGLDYFPLDVTMDRTDDDVEMLEAKYGSEGFCILIKLYMKIYQNEGYYIKWGEKEGLLHSKRVNVDFNLVNDVVNDLVHWGIFDKGLFDKFSILTSKRIQDTYMEAVKSRKNVAMIDSILLINEVNSNINLVNSDIYPQSKEKKKKVNKSTNFTPPTIEEVSEYCKQRKNSVDCSRFIDFYSMKGWMVGKNKMKDWKAAVRTWEKNDSKSTSKKKLNIVQSDLTEYET